MFLISIFAAHHFLKNLASDFARSAAALLRIHQHFHSLLLRTQIESLAPFRNRQLGRHQIVEPDPRLSKNLHHAIPGLGGVADGANPPPLTPKNRLGMPGNVASIFKST